MAAAMLAQGAIYFMSGPQTVKYFYPAAMHLPLLIMLCIFEKALLWPLVSVLTAYMCCQTRRWLALLIMALFSGGPMMQNIAELAVTVPLLLLLLRFVAPSVRAVSHYASFQKYWFGLVPALYYCFDYLTVIYTSLFSDGNAAVLEFMPFVCGIVYLVFVIRVSEDERTRIRLEETLDILNMQVTQSVREIALLRESQRKTRAYRHDLRHHMQHLLTCLENGRPEQAQTYIQEICSEIEAAKVVTYCENEAANLIFSAFAARAKDNGISINIQAAIPCDMPMSESDLCVLLSNALENALNSCQKLVKTGRPASIDVSAYEKRGKIFLQVSNSCDSGITFSNGIPVASGRGHGIGTRSICAIAEHYGGIYSFSCKDGRFILRVSL